jgi:hypothetical protein
MSDVATLPPSHTPVVRRHAVGIAAAVWAFLLAGTFLAPLVRGSADCGDELTRNTVRLALAYYAAAAGLMLFLAPSEWAGSGRGRLARACWSLAWAAYLVHLGMAFHYYHHWSHADAVRRTAEVSGFGPGVYVSHLFTLAWTFDVALWWLRPARYAARPRWADALLHGFMAFVIFCGTVVYETGPIRYAGLLLFGALGVLAARRARAAAGERAGAQPGERLP